MKQRRILAIVAIVLVLVIGATVLVACNNGHDYNSTLHTYRTYASSFPTMWNVLDYETSDSSDMFSYLQTSFYEFDYKFDADGNVVDGQFNIIPVMASDFPTDVTSEYDGDEAGWGIPEGANSRAWYIPIRKGLTWDNGDPIVPEDWVWSMKAQLDPEYQNYRADSYYASSVVLHNAKNYVYKGQTIMVSDSSMEAADFNWSQDLYVGLDTPSYLLDASGICESLECDPNMGSLYIDAYVNYYLAEAEAAWEAGEDLAKGAIKKADYATVEEFGQAYVDYKMTGEGTNALRTAVANIYAYLTADDTPYETEGVQAGAVKLNGNDTLEGLLLDLEAAIYGQNMGFHIFFPSYVSTYPDVTFDEVGIKAVDDGERYGIIIILDQPLVDNGSHFTWAYDFGGNWLVKQDVYEACEVAPSDGSTLKTSTYMTSPETSPSYGPYVLDTFQSGKFYRFVKNENWFGYDLECNEGLYETDAVECTYIAEWDTAWMAFQKGELSGIGIDVKIANEYKTSDRAYFTPDDYVDTLQIQSQADALVDPDDGSAKEILLNNKFRKALSLAIDRVAYAQQCTTSSQAGFGLYNSMHYYDVENGGRYRDTDTAKQVICDVYGVNVADYDSLDEAYEAVTGLNIAMAKQLVAEAIAEELAAGTIKATDKLAITYGSSVDSESARRPYNFLQKAWEVIFDGTQFDGEGFAFAYDGTHGDNFANDFKAGQYEVLSAGWSGAAWDPFYFIMAYIDIQYRYAVGWDPEAIDLTITLPLGDNGADFDLTMNVLEWQQALNSAEGLPDFGEGGLLDTEHRLVILGELEAVVLESYYSIPITYSFGASLRSYQIEAFTDTYNTFMGWGGIKYYSYNYTDGEWWTFVDKDNKGTLNYK